MRFTISLLIAASVALPAHSQVFRLTREQMIKYTAKNPFERFPDGRPKVDDKMLERVKGLSLEEAWGILLSKGYKHQFAGWDFQILHPGQKLVGRAVTAQYLPLRPDLAEVLLHRPRRTVLNPAWKWGVFYPLRRSGKFAQLPPEEQRVILAEHGAIGMSFGAGDYAHDIRLACHGLDKDDNDFVIGLIGKELYPLSALVQTMRKTQQTSLYLERLGPFFVGRALWQSTDA